MEKVNIVDNFGNITNKIVTKDLAHKKGYLHPVIHIWIYNNKKQILLQKRSNKKVYFPNYWDISCAGHISANEGPLISALRELKEELGIKIKKNQLIFLGCIIDNCRWKNCIENNLAYVFLLEYNYSIKKIQLEELDSIKFIDFKDFEKKIKNLRKNKITDKEPGYYEFIVANLKKRL